MPALISQKIRSNTGVDGSVDTCVLTYSERFLRRKMLKSKGGVKFLVDLPKVTSLSHGDGFELSDGQIIMVVAADEELLEISGGELARLAWHIGNRHTPCQIEPDRLLIQKDHVLQEMLEQLGAVTKEITARFTPQGGAYGHGRTLGHSHGDKKSHSHD